MHDLKTILERLLKAAPQYETQSLKTRVFEAWPTIVGERVARQCRPQHIFDDGTLLITASSSAWLQSLRYLEAQILEKYERALGGKKVKALRFKLDGGP